MNISPKTIVSELLDEYPFLLDYLVTLSPRYALLRNPIARKTVASVATLTQASAIGGLSADDFIARISAEIERHTGSAPALRADPSTDEPITDPAARREMLKAIIRGLHDGGSLDEAKKQFARVVKDVNASEIAAMEQQLIAEGLPQEEVKRLCDVHVQVFKESIQVKDAPSAPEGHPVNTFMAENRALERLLTRLEEALTAVGTPVSPDKYASYYASIERLLASIQKVHVHYARKENQLFPVLERHQITGPTQVMWSLDDDIRAMVKKCAGFHTQHDAASLKAASADTLQALRDMIYKEERILFPMSLETLNAAEWDEIARGEADIGYAWIEPAKVAARSEVATTAAGLLSLQTGELSLEQINMMLTALPLDVSFVDENDEVRYYSASRDRIFPRSPAVIGRKVQNCHPPKSMPRVQEILDGFREGRLSEAEFWITTQGKFVHIRYFAMRDSAGAYRGCLEVTQDVTAIRALEGERRLLA